MPSLVISQDTVTVNACSEHLELVRRPDSDGESMVRMRVPLFDVDRAVVVGRPGVTIPALQKLMKCGIPAYFVSSHGRWIGTLSPDNNLDAARRIRQYKLHEDAALALSVARKIVNAKIRNSKRVIQRLSSNRGESAVEIQTKTSISLDQMADLAAMAGSLEELRGFEGMAAALYFSRLGDFFPDATPFKGRNRRPPKDAANALLSWTYAIVQGEIDAAARSHGLDPCIGFLHEVSHGTPSLVMDLLEPLRGPVCDMLALHLLNHKILTPDSFEFCAEDGGTYLRASARKDFFYSYENSMTRKFTARKGLPHTDFRKVIDDSVCSILKALEGRDDYEFFIMP